MKLRCLAVDDESLARKMLEDNIRQVPFLELARSCKNAFEAMQVLQETPIDLIFLDIQMPGMLGTQFLHSLPEKPMVIFVTAYPNYAVESYDLDVIDYLMKPVSLERFTKAAYKALDAQRKKEALAAAPKTAPPAAVSEPEQPDFFFVNVEYSLVKIPVCDITHIEGMKDYVKIYLQSTKKPVLTKSTLKAMEEKLPPRGFFRVHKSFIVRLDKIESLRNKEIRIGEHEIPVGEGNWEELLQQLNYSR
ncbi:MAG: LytTR family DNA-binding domain-containing protein [Thermoanaerobaculia bacterium]|nr:LytTR family DNA-binding domain-containing protein [Thermoanaerobaculia bacterium]